MDANDNPLHDLTPPQVVEYARHRLLEVVYWQHVLDDAQGINEALIGIVTKIADGTASCLHLLLVAPPEALRHLEAVMTGNTAAMTQAKALEQSLQRLIDLAEGRGKTLQLELDAIRTAAGLEPGDDGESAES